jgi:hypothetical protein
MDCPTPDLSHVAIQPNQPAFAQTGLMLAQNTVQTVFNAGSN